MLQKTFHSLSIASGAMLLALLFTGAGCLALWYGNGGRIVAVQSGSMRPLFSTGDALLVSPMPTYRPGDIVRYQSPGNPGVTIAHRITHINKQTGWLTTKGDALSRPDQAIPPRLVQGRVIAVAPGLGRLLDLLHTPAALLALIYIPALALLTNEAWRLARQLRVPYRVFGYR
ncbi:MAG: peptidase signal peptidase [Candidatus Saccharibacteria bacterium]|nr:peptidase signal peptidase [Candidatus Saccharibacteria bacterium]